VKKIDPNARIFYLIRHAEKRNDATRNPDLSDKGKERVKNYINYFSNIKLDSVYTTNFKRTFQTANPIATSKGIKPIYYNPSLVNLNYFVKKHKGQSVLIVGHSNTTPNFANKLLGKMAYTQMMENDYSSIYKITITEKDTMTIKYKIE
jgi:broad specificity phosphatase PhoE